MRKVRYFNFLVLMLSIAWWVGGCKDEEKNPCVENVVGNWNCEAADSTQGCSLQVALSIVEEAGCDIVISNLPYDCNQSNFQVRATVSNGTITINSQPFGSGTITGQGTVYLNQLTLTTASIGATYEIVGSK